MADIIDFRAKAKPLYKGKANKDNDKFGEIILFSGVRIERDDVTKLNPTDLEPKWAKPNNL